MSALNRRKVALVGLAVLLALCAFVNAQNEETFPAVHIDDTVFADALLSFHTLADATEIGVGYVDYKRLLLDAKTDFDMPIAKFPKSAQRKDLEEVMQDFIVAGDVWGIALDNIDWCRNRNQEQGVPMKTDFYRRLRTRYGEKVLPPPKFGYCAKQTSPLNLIWT